MAAVEFDQTCLVQLIPEYEEVTNVDWNEFNPRIFQAFEEETQLNVKNTLKQMQTMHIEFSGQLIKGKKEGKGAFFDKVTEEFYFGQWQNNQKHGYGIIFYGDPSKSKKNLGL